MALIIKGNFDELADSIGDATTNCDDRIGVFAILVVGKSGFTNMKISIFVGKIVIRGSFVGDSLVIHKGFELADAGREINGF